MQFRIPYNRTPERGKGGAGQPGKEGTNNRRRPSCHLGKFGRGKKGNAGRTRKPPRSFIRNEKEEDQEGENCPPRESTPGGQKKFHRKHGVAIINTKKKKGP